MEMPSGVRVTSAAMRWPVVMSASSPPSFCTAHRALPSSTAHSAGSTSTVTPFGVSNRSVSGSVPVSSSRAAPADASAAQVPVV